MSQTTETVPSVEWYEDLAKSDLEYAREMKAGQDEYNALSELEQSKRLSVSLEWQLLRVTKQLRGLRDLVDDVREKDGLPDALGDMAIHRMMFRIDFPESN